MPIKGIKFATRYFYRGSVCVYGERGSGKDMLMSNVAIRMPEYISNIDYGGKYHKLEVNKLNVNNTYDNFLSGDVNYYEYPYPKGAHLFMSDIGVHLPCQYNDQLNKKYPYLPTFIALCRQLTEDKEKGIAGAEFHWNAQDLRRCWDKFREQSSRYVMCRGVCKPLLKLGIVVQRIRVYELYESALRRVPPFRMPKPKVTDKREVKQAYEIEKERYAQTYGRVDEYVLIYRNKSTYNTAYFKDMLKNGK